MSRRAGWVALIAVNALFYCVLSFYRTSEGAPKPPVQPFANSVQQRIDMITELREIKELLKEQNALLRSGELTVIVAEPAKR